MAQLMSDASQPDLELDGTGKGRLKGWDAVALALPLAVTLWLYGRSLGYGFFNDDPTGHFAWMERYDIGRLYVISAGYGFFRPLVFTAWKLLWSLFQGYQAAAFHGLSLTFHIGNVLLVYLLSRRLGGRLYATVASLAFSCFPFNYEAVAYVAALFHPMLTCLALLALLAYDQYLSTKRRRFLAAVVLLHLLALLTHENGVIIPALLLGWDFCLRPPARWRDILQRWSIRLGAVSLAYLFLWRSIPKSAEQGLQPPDNVIRNALALWSQLASYPLMPLVRPSSGEVLLIVTLLFAALALLLALVWRRRERRIYFFGLVWLAAATLPSAISLEPAYLYGSPRLYYLGSIGAALLWALPARLASRRPGSGQDCASDDGAQYRSRRLLSGATLVALIVLLSLQPLRYVTCQMHFMQEVTGLVREMGVLAAQEKPQTAITWVNLPYYFSSCQHYPQGCDNPYPYAPVGAVVLPPYASPSDLARVNGDGVDRPMRSVTVHEYAPGWALHSTETLTLDALREELRGARVYVMDLLTLSWVPLHAVWHTGADPMAYAALFGERVGLAGWRVTREGDTLAVTLEWQAVRNGAAPLTVFVHLYREDGSLAAQHDGPPAGGFVPPNAWHAGDIITDTHRLVLDPDTAAENCTLVTGIYDPQTGIRLNAVSDAGETIPNNAAVLLTGPLP